MSLLLFLFACDAAAVVVDVVAVLVEEVLVCFINTTPVGASPDDEKYYGKKEQAGSEGQ